MTTSQSPPTGGRPDRVRRIDRLAALPPARLLWGAVLLVMVGDLVSTVYGLRQGFAEGNPVVATVLAAHGTAGLVALKGVALAWACGIWYGFRRRYGVAALVGLLIPQALALCSNLLLILSS